jgi:hypothetical protein
MLPLFLIAVVAASLVSEEKEASVAKISSIPIPWRSEAVLEDVCENGIVLLNAIGLPGDEKDSLLLWDLEEAKSVSQVRMNDWAEEESALYKAGLPWTSGPFRCLDGGRRVIGLHGMYMVLFDAEKQAEVAHILPSKDLNDNASPLLHVMWHVTDRTLDVNRKSGLIAAAFNWGVKPRVFVYTPDLRKLLISWELPRYMEDIRWSPDGQNLTVLYSGAFDANGAFMGAKVDFKPTGIPDVEIFDASSGKSLFKFFSGELEAKIAFSFDGARLYTIGLTKYNGKRQDRAIRMFSSQEGTLLQTMKVPPWGVQNNLALSPDSRFIVADGSTPAPSSFFKEIFTEESFYRKEARLVILNAQSGKLLFEHHEKTFGEAWGVSPMRFGFSPDSHLLMVDPNYAGWGDNEHVDVYSLDGLRTAATQGK